MAQRVQHWSSARHILFVAGCLTVTQLPFAQGQGGVKAPEWKHGMDLKARKAIEDKFDAKTQKYGVEVFLDPNSGKLAYISETGSLAALSGNAGGGDKSKEPEFSHGLKLRVRKAGEKDFGKDTKEYGVEVYRDDNANTLIYLCETGAVAVVPLAGAKVPAKVLPPEWRHGLEMPVRKVGDDRWDNAFRFGLEVFVDANNGNVIYITDTGAISVVPGGGLAVRPEKVAPPVWKHGMELKVRNAGDADFNDKTPKISMEVFFDPNASKTVVITEKGSISVLNGNTSEGKSKDPVWKHGLEMAARKAGQKEFDKNTPKFGLEAYADEITNSLIYIVQTGAISAVPAK